MMLSRGPLLLLCVITATVLTSCSRQTQSVATSSGESTATENNVGDSSVSADVGNGEASDSSANTQSAAASSAPASPKDKEPPKDGEIVEIVFEDIQLPIQEDMVFRPFMLTDRARELDGQRIRIHGYMLPDTRTKGIKQFVLLKNTECKFGPGGQADHLLNVLMADGVTAKFRDDPISVEGTLKVSPFQGPDGNTWSIYDLTCDRVIRYRPRR